MRLVLVVAFCLQLAPKGNGGSAEQLESGIDACSAATPIATPVPDGATFALPAGFRAEIVAAQPLIEAPVQAAFDADGRLWVVESRASAHSGAGRISVLADDDGDGRMDRASVFLDSVDSPRAVAPARGGALVVAPPNLLFCQDTDGDGRADAQTIVDTGLSALASAGNPGGLLPTLDNAFQCPASDLRVRFVLGQWTKQRTTGGGAGGITRDDLGRVYFTDASDFLRADFVPSFYLARNPHVEPGPLVNAACALEQWTRPASKETAGEARNGRAAAACGPLVYRGGALPAEFRGNAFVCEPSQHLVKCLRFEERPPYGIAAKNAFTDREFLSSTDESFCPVNLADGPDGALYVVDMHGRIWRIVHESMPKHAVTKLSRLPLSELVGLLTNANGWTRDTAQRLLVESGSDDPRLLTALRALANASRPKLGRIHALWTLEGLRRIDADTCQKALEAIDVDVRITGLRVAEPLLAHDAGPPIQFLLGCAAQPDARLQQQAFATLSGAIDPGILAGLILRDAHDPECRRAAQSGLGSNQLLFLNATLLSLNTPDHFAWDDSGGRAELVRSLAAAVVREGRTTEIGTLLTQFVPRATPKPWTRIALIDGALEGRGSDPHGRPALVRLASRPDSLLALLDGPDVGLASKVAELADALAWPGDGR